MTTAAILYPTYPHTIGTPVSLGSASGTANNPTFTTGSNILAHDVVVVGVGLNASSNVTAVSDGTNSYTLGFRAKVGNGGVEVWYCSNCAAVSSGATVTVSVTGVSQIVIGGARVAGTYNQTPFVNTSTTASSTVTSSALTSTPAIMFGFHGGFNETAYTESTGFTNLLSLQQSTNQVWLNYAYKATTAVTAVTYNPTVTGAGNNSGIGILGFA